MVEHAVAGVPAMSTRTDGKPLWRVRPIDGMTIDESAGRVFVGNRAEMIEHIGRLHRESGKQHAATSEESGLRPLPASTTA